MLTSEAIHPDQHADGNNEGGDNTAMKPGAFVRLEQTEGVTLVHGERAVWGVRWLNTGMVRIRLFKRGEAIDWTTSAGVLGEEERKQNLKSGAFRNEATEIDGNVAVSVTETDCEIVCATSDARLVIVKSDLTWRLEDATGKALAQSRKLNWTKRGETAAWLDMPQTSHVYGLGEKTSFLDKRGERYTMWNSDIFDPHVPEIEALYESIPFMLHMNQGSVYGLFLDNPGRTDFDMRHHGDQYRVASHVGAFDLYLMVGPDMKDVIQRYTALTGRVSLPPKWALGYHQSRYSYVTQQEVLELARTFREKGIACDVIYLDIHYMDEYRVFTFDQDRFPDPEAMMNELAEMGIRIVPIVDPGVKQDARYPIYQEGVRAGHFCAKLEGDLFIGKVWPGDSAFPDFTDDAASHWWGEKHRFYTELGIRGVWNDMNEPAVFNESKTMDLDVMHKNNGKPMTHEELHNLYGMLMSRATYLGLKEQIDGERPFVLTRAGYSGIQRYAAVWTGDNRSFWEHMSMAIPMVLNMGMSGLAFAGPDVGGFAHDTSPELLTRWMQMGVFFPYFRNHSNIGTIRQEPWSFGEQVEDINRRYIELRYRLMPHLYTLFREASETGMPVIRPLVLEYPHDPNVTNMCDQFLFGSDMLVAPILRPGTTFRGVYLPEGVWYDFWTGERHEGGRAILADAPLEKMPIYVKEGGIITEGLAKLHADDRKDDAERDAITFTSYGLAAEGESAYTLYEDDGVTFAFEQGSYNVLRVTASREANGAALSYSYANHGFAARRTQLTFQMKHLGFEPTAVEGAASWTYEAASDTLNITVSDDVESRSLRIQG
ncbi:glycoside hydrolase family 31 protein [Paenibacillus sp. 481]|uniref:glycoside hydrolase family 31 protein n=1 Tax=Paenibacillus sp. 481 TaxID=2835869 RepID=UPI001E418D3D|nr:TIM-barrel domain-containing protein [Paenibacillus sp. 481]UHA75025.1 DUF5110 domain-containing protein [Paenibacillus sp. 481]